MGASQMQMIARSYLVYDITRSPAILGLVSVGFAPPMFCLSLFGGAIADRLERKRIIQIGQVSHGLLAFFIAVSITTGTVTWVHLLVVSMLQGAIWSFVMPARLALISQLVGRERISNAMGVSITTLMAPAATGGVYAVWGADTAYYVIGTLVLVPVLLTSPLPKLSSGAVKARSAITKDIGAGLSYIRRSPLVMGLLGVGLTTALLAMPFRFLMPVFVVEIYHRGPGALGILASIMGGGALVGSLFIVGLGRSRRGLVLISGIFVTGMALLGTALLPYFFVALGLMIVLGIGDAARRALNQALIMEVTEDQYRGRVMSVFMINYALMPVGILPAGIAAEFFGGQVAVGALAVLLLATGAVILATQRGLRELP